MQQRDALIAKRVDDAFRFIGRDTPRALEAVSDLIVLTPAPAAVAGLLHALAAQLRAKAWRPQTPRAS